MRATVEIELMKCHECNCDMLDITRHEYKKHSRPTSGILYNIFPKYHKKTLLAQTTANDWYFRTDFRNTEGYICEVCANSGKASFFCEACETEKPPEKIKKRFGDPDQASYLCSDCYLALTAHDWDKLIDRLEDKHRYDYL